MGRSKAMLPFGDEMLLQRLVRLVAEGGCSPVIVAAAVGQDLPELERSVEVVRDPIDDRGPLAGIAAGLGAMAGRAEWAYATATDTPLLHRGWVATLAEHAEGWECVMPVVGDRPQPLSALYRVDVALSASRRLLTLGTGRLLGLAARLRTRFVAEAEIARVDPEFESIRNLNTPGDYESALRRLERRDG